MIRRSLALTALAAAACGGKAPAPAIAPAPSAPAVTPPAATTCRDLSLPANDEPAVSMAVWFAVGSNDDPPGKEGLANLTAQMLAQGSTKANRYEAILKLLYPMAASYEVSVDREMTVFSGRAPTGQAAQFGKLFGDAIVAPAFDAADFERLRRESLSFLEKSLRYALDEELAKAGLMGDLFAGTGYAHPPEGTVASLQKLTIDDVRGFWRDHYTPDRCAVGLAGGWKGQTLDRISAELPRRAAPAPRAEAPELASAMDAAGPGRTVLLIDKPGADASISFGERIPVRRGHPDFAALYLVASWLGEHRNQSSHLYQVIREARGLNYGDYAYVEAYPRGGWRQTPPPNVSRNAQAFEVWIRTLPNGNALFALRAALREIDKLIANGLTKEQFELTRDFLRRYTLHFAPSTHDRLLWHLDDAFYGQPQAHLDALREELDKLTVEQVNAAIARHLTTQNLRIVIATGEAAKLKEQLVSGAPTTPTYPTPKSDAILAEDKEIAAYPLGIAPLAIQTVKVDEMFARGGR